MSLFLTKKNSTIDVWQSSNCTFVYQKVQTFSFCKEGIVIRVRLTLFHFLKLISMFLSFP